MKKIFLLTNIIFGLFLGGNGQDKPLTVGDQIPVFTLRDQNDRVFNSAEYAGKKMLVIYFYPRDESSGCTKEACSFRDSYSEFTKADAVVIGINSGTVESHQKFIQHHQLPFTLLSDPGNQVLKMFGVKSKFFVTGRKTFVVDKTGKIVFTFDSFMNGPAHEKEALNFIQNMQKKTP